MRGSRLVVTALVLGLALASPALAQKKGKPSKQSASADGVVQGEIGAKLEEYMTSKANFPNGFSGCVLVASKGEILLQRGYGIADADKDVKLGPDALWDWCSVTKQFTAAAVLKLEMQKKLSIEDPLKKFFPKCPDDKAGVTLRHMLNHTSGIGVPALEGVDPRDREEVVKAFLTAPIVSKPGEKWEYSNMAYVVLGVIIEKLSGKTYEGYCEEQLFEPAGMKDAGFVGDGKIDLKRVPRDARGHGPQFAYGYEMTWGYRGCGGAVASVKDMLLWHQALSGTKILSDAAKREYYTVGLNNYALGWEVSKDSGRLTYAHSGHTGQVVTYFLRDVDDDIVVALACNEEPATHPQITASNLAVIARKAK